MILIYHNIRRRAKDDLTVGIRNFAAQMWAVKDKKAVYLDDYDPRDENQVVITFDDGYKGVVRFALPILKKLGLKFEVFLVDDFYRRGENGDKGFMNRHDLDKITAAGGRLQYHTKSHPHLEETADIDAEIKVPEDLKVLDPSGFKWLAYPFCTYNQAVIDAAAKYYIGARSGKGLGDDNDRFRLDALRMDDYKNRSDPLPLRLRVFCLVL